MSTTAFDTLTYAKKLQQAGFTAQQAEIQAKILKEIIEVNLATKRDLENVKKDLAIRMGVMLATAVGILITVLIKLH